MSNAIITEAEKLGSEVKALVEKLEAKLKSLLPSEHHHSVDEAIHTSVEETGTPELGGLNLDQKIKQTEAEAKRNIANEQIKNEVETTNTGKSEAPDPTV